MLLKSSFKLLLKHNLINNLRLYGKIKLKHCLNSYNNIGIVLNYKRLLI